MAIGERIRFFRTMRGMTQKQLGKLLGFPERSADVRMAQYESGNRSPKADLTTSLAQALGVSTGALDVPDIDSYTGLMHTLFTLEDRYGLSTAELEDGQPCLYVKASKGTEADALYRMIEAWRAESVKLERGEITQEDYDRWRYFYPRYDTTRRWARVPPRELADDPGEASAEPEE